MGLQLTGTAHNRQISTIMAQYEDAKIDQSILGRFFDNQDLTRFQTLLDDNRLPPTRLRLESRLKHFEAQLACVPC